jgi:hypothetical protein
MTAQSPRALNFYTLAGSLVAKQCKGLETIDMSAMSSGVYVLRVTIKDGTHYHEKIAKE